MTFTQFARGLALIMLFLGLSQIVLGFSLAYFDHPDPSRYLGRKTTGQAIDRGFLYIVLASALGTLTDISRRLSSRG